MSFRLVLVFEPISTEGALVLLLSFMGSEKNLLGYPQNTRHGTSPDVTYRSSSSESNFLGFLGQHSHIYGPLSFEANPPWLFGISANFRGDATVRVICAGNSASPGFRYCGDGAPADGPAESKGEVDVLLGGG